MAAGERELVKPISVHSPNQWELMQNGPKVAWCERSCRVKCIEV